MKFKNTLIALLILALACSSFAACAGDGEQNTEENTAQRSMESVHIKTLLTVFAKPSRKEKFMFSAMTGVTEMRTVQKNSAPR